MKILAIADVEQSWLTTGFDPERLRGVNMIISCGDLPARYLEHVVTMANLPLLYVPGNHDTAYRAHAPEGCDSIDGRIREVAGVRIMGFGGSMRYNERVYGFTEQEMRRRVMRLAFQAKLTGGVDIVAKALRRNYQDINFGTIIMCLNVVIIGVYGLIFRKWDAVMYTIIAQFIVSKAIDTVMYGFNTSKVCYLISESKSMELEQTITSTMHRGVTLLHGAGGYTGESREVLMCVIKKRQITELRKIVKAVDPGAFFIVTDAKDVFGNGFGNINDD